MCKRKLKDKKLMCCICSNIKYRKPTIKVIRDFWLDLIKLILPYTAFSPTNFVSLISHLGNLSLHSNNEIKPI
jgi:hypothetical protein